MAELSVKARLELQELQENACAAAIAGALGVGRGGRHRTWRRRRTGAPGHTAGPGEPESCGCNVPVQLGAGMHLRPSRSNARAEPEQLLSSAPQARSIEGGPKRPERRGGGGWCAAGSKPRPRLARLTDLRGGRCWPRLRCAARERDDCKDGHIRVCPNRPGRVRGGGRRGHQGGVRSQPQRLALHLDRTLFFVTLPPMALIHTPPCGRPAPACVPSRGGFPVGAPGLCSRSHPKGHSSCHTACSTDVL